MPFEGVGVLEDAAADCTLAEIASLPVGKIATPTAHLYLWVPNALLPDGPAVMKAWGFTYKSNLVWHKIRKDGGSDGRGVGFHFRNVTELILFGVRRKNARTFAPGQRQVNLLATRKREHSRKRDEQHEIIEACIRDLMWSYSCAASEKNGRATISHAAAARRTAPARQE